MSTVVSVPENNPLENAQGLPRIAVVGAGLAGLSAAWLLKQKYQVTLFESHSTPGMGVYTSDYHSNGQHTRIDIPLRIFTQGYYPELFALYKYLGIDMENSDHAAVFQYHNAKTGKTLIPFFQYKNINVLNKKFRLLHNNSLNRTGLLLTMAHLRFLRRARIDVKKNKADLIKITFGQYVQQKGFNKQYINDVLLPGLAVTCTCDYSAILAYPADLILDFMTCGIMQQGVVRAKLGVDDVVPKLTQGYQVLCNEQVQSVIADNHHKGPVTLVSRNAQTNTQQEYEFDYVIMATQANIAQQILAEDAPTQQSQLLQNVPMQSSTMVLHTDTAMVSNQREASAVSYIIDKEHARPSTSVDLSKAFNTYSQQAPVFQTWNVIKKPKPECIISQAQFTRPLVTLSSRESISRLMEINEKSRIKICGSYMANKIPLLDAAVESSVKLARNLGCDIPWDKTDKQIPDDYQAPVLAY